MQLLEEYIEKELDRLKKENIRCNVIGKIGDLPLSVREAVEKAIRETKDNEAMILTLALSYGSRSEIIGAVKRICQDILRGNIGSEEIDEELFGQYLNTFGLPDPDLLIRTSGELRVSNFLLWQIAYSELYFTPKLWPDFRENDLLLALLDYQKRERRFGLTSQQLASREQR
jgi:undecaprenyl diphosphate synthase